MCRPARLDLTLLVGIRRLSLPALLLATCAAARAAAPAPAASSLSSERAAAADVAARSSANAPTGSVHDFDYFAGAWTTRQRRLVARGVGSDQWEEFPATLCMNPYLDGAVTVDELYFPTKGWAGVTVRAFDAEKRQWHIYWISSRTGRLDPPVVGGFDGNRGEFYGHDVDAGRPVEVRYRWTKLDQNHAHWEQAFTYDAGRSWETNWTADFTRADAATVCAGGRPKRK